MDSDSVFNPLGFVITTFHFPSEIPVTVTEPDVKFVLFCFKFKSPFKVSPVSSFNKMAELLGVTFCMSTGIFTEFFAFSATFIV